ncbi:MAG: diacylglycerol/lipid kinase family protein [Spirochaetales bacterium]
MQRRILVIINRRHERLRARRANRIVARRFTRLGIPHDIVFTKSMREIVSRASSAAADGFTEVLCIGGDGTINLVANGLYRDKIVLSVVRGGTGNILAKHLGVPASIRGALRIVEESPVLQHIDCIRRADRLSLLNVSMGLSSLTMTYADDRLKRVLGVGAYAFHLLQQLVRRKSTRFTVSADGREYSFRGREAIVCNIGFPKTALDEMFGDSNPEDGLLELLVFRMGSFRAVFFLLIGIMTGDRSHERFYVDRIRFSDRLSVTTEPPLPIQSDGDRIGEGSIELGVARKALTVRAPVGVTPGARSRRGLASGAPV